MFISSAFAQEAGTAAAAGDGSGTLGLITQLFPLIFIFAIMYFLVLRPQRQRQKAHMELIRNVRRGDTIVTSGGLIGKVSKVVDETEIQVEIAEGTRVRVARSAISEVRAKGEPVKEEAASA
jgi:preprotein translocase subunit YajC